MTPLEIIVSALGITSVWLTVRQNPLCWPIGLLMVLLYARFFFDARLYSAVLLHGVFAAMQLYGWWQWRQGVDDSGRRPVSSAGRNEILIGLGAALLLGLVLGLAMARLTEAVYPGRTPCSPPSACSPSCGWRSSAGSAGCCGSWSTCSMSASSLSGYWLTAGLYGVFTALAVLGLREWRASRTAPA